MRAADERAFYRSSEAYLFDLTAFAMTGTKLPYLEMLSDAVPPGARLLDYGCGIGSDGLMLLEAGYRVEFADFANPSTAYLRWRLEKRGLEAPVHDVERFVPGGFDAAYAFDVIEHVSHPFGFLRELESRASMVEVNFLEYDPNEQYLHHELPIPELLAHVCRQRLVTYRLFHRTSHVVVYRPGQTTVSRQLGNRLSVSLEQRLAVLRTGAPAIRRADRRGSQP
jgi:SAM-dependent methyltransferase